VVPKFLEAREPSPGAAVGQAERGETTMRRMFSVLTMATVMTAAVPAQAGGGTLDKDAIRKVVRAHIEEIRHCYNEGLLRKPELGGKLMVDFEIAASGAVSSSTIAESTLGDATVETCIAGAVKSWKFPQPQGGSVQVSYPFELQPG
jgi:TonB family protein